MSPAGRGDADETTKSNTTVPLVIEGLDASHDIILHGIDLFVPKDDTSQVGVQPLGLDG